VKFCVLLSCIRRAAIVKIGQPGELHFIQCERAGPPAALLCLELKEIMERTWWRSGNSYEAGGRAGEDPEGPPTVPKKLQYGRRWPGELAESGGRNRHQEVIMKQFLRACVFLILVTSAGHAQTTVFIQERVTVSHALAGYADLGMTKTPAEGITVALCSSDWSTVLASTQTNARGYFSLEAPKAGSIFYLRLSAPGVNPYQLRVRIKKGARSELRVHLSNAA
jgi:hypothetical protein